MQNGGVQKDGAPGMFCGIETQKPTNSLENWKARNYQPLFGKKIGLQLKLPELMRFGKLGLVFPWESSIVFFLESIRGRYSLSKQLFRLKAGKPSLQTEPQWKLTQ